MKCLNAPSENRRQQQDLTRKDKVRRNVEKMDKQLQNELTEWAT